MTILVATDRSENSRAALRLAARLSGLLGEDLTVVSVVELWERISREIFRALIPHVTRLVALHFQRTLVNRALTRLRRSGEESELEFAVAVAESGQLEVAWRA